MEVSPAGQVTTTQTLTKIKNILIVPSVGTRTENNMTNTIQDMLIHLSDIIDMHDYDEDWEIKAQGIITKISKEIKEPEIKEVI